MNVLIISLNFHPGHFSHLVANYKLYRDCGFTSYLYVNKLFNHMDKKNEFNKINSPKEFRKIKTIDTAVFWFPSLKNIIEIIRLKIFYKTNIIYVYHEPFDSIKNYYNSGFRFKKIAKICLINFVNLPVIFFSNQIVLPSLSSFFLYKRKYTLLNKHYSLIPLIFDDEADLLVEDTSKNFISYIGTIAADHAFDKFVNFVNAAINNNWFPNLNFLIATSSKIPDKEKSILNAHLISGKVIISEGHVMSNEEINSYYKKSFIVWNAYNRSMQSGVLPKAYMFGAAVISLFRNSNEFIDNHKTGILINDNNNVIEIKDAVDEVFLKKDLFSQNCREMFLNRFFYKNNIENFISLLDNKHDKT
jgi:hypothetical protein